jgi:membrane-associated phospholipid phosphatase
MARRYIRNKAQLLVNQLKLLTIEVAAVILAFLLSLFLVVFLVERIFFLKENEFDHQVFSFLHSFVSDTATAVMQFFTWFGSQYFLIPAYITLMIYYFFIKRNKWLGIKVAAVSVSSLLMMFSLKYLFNRPRPADPLLKEAAGLSFPSGHAFMSFSFFALIFYIIHKAKIETWKKVLLFFFLGIIVAMVGLSRIYLRVHYTTDVIAGFCIGFMWIIISLGILQLLEKRKRKLPPVQ